MPGTRYSTLVATAIYGVEPWGKSMSVAPSIEETNAQIMNTALMSIPRSIRTVSAQGGYAHDCHSGGITAE